MYPTPTKSLWKVDSAYTYISSPATLHVTYRVMTSDGPYACIQWMSYRSAVWAELAYLQGLDIYHRKFTHILFFFFFFPLVGNVFNRSGVCGAVLIKIQRFRSSTILRNVGIYHKTGRTQPRKFNLGVMNFIEYAFSCPFGQVLLRCMVNATETKSRSTYESVERNVCCHSRCRLCIPFTLLS